MTSRLTQLAVDAVGIARLTMRDDARRNALSIEMVAELEERLAELRANPSVKVVILAGSDEYFSTGANRAVLDDLTSSRIKPRDLLLPRCLLDVEVPIVAAMAGHAIGGGLVLGICCDITVAARESRYGATFMQYGFTPGLGSTLLLEYAMGSALAHEMLLTGRTFRGTHFENRGAFNHVVPRSDVCRRALTIARDLADKPRLPLVTLKCALSSRKRALFEAARTQEALMHDITFATADVTRRIDELE